MRPSIAQVLIVLLVVVVLAGAGWFYYARRTGPGPGPLTLGPVPLGNSEASATGANTKGCGTKGIWCGVQQKCIEPWMEKCVAPTSTDSSFPEYTAVRVALLGNPGPRPFQPVEGCDIVIMKQVFIPPTTAPLTAAMKELFARTQPWPYATTTPGNYITKQKNLSFDHATVSDGVASVYLLGSNQMAGECDSPRLSIVVGSTALQFPNIKSVNIYLNGTLWTTPSPKGS